ncbi:MAG: hypothetical protein GX795_12385 [Firmicutes bacterium]|jgi:hypothetical protein|nr:hypothetical protein [Bacillota bacterium]
MADPCNETKSVDNNDDTKDSKRSTNRKTEPIRTKRIGEMEELDLVGQPLSESKRGNE